MHPHVYALEALVGDRFQTAAPSQPADRAIDAALRHSLAAALGATMLAAPDPRAHALPRGAEVHVVGWCGGPVPYADLYVVFRELRWRGGERWLVYRVPAGGPPATAADVPAPVRDFYSGRPVAAAAAPVLGYGGGL